MGVPVRVAGSASAAARGADLIATCTPARAAYLRASDVRPGAFIAAVGADSQGKQELEPALVAKARVIADSAIQVATMGDTQHAIAGGWMRAEDIAAELGELLAGRARGRTDEDQIVVFDSTGTALQDVAAAVAVYERALAAGAGFEYPLG